MQSSYHFVIALSYLKYVSTVQGKISLLEVLGAIDFTSARKNANHVIVSSEGNQRGIFPKAESFIQNTQPYSWVNYSGVEELWTNSTLSSLSYESVADHYKNSIILHPDSHEVLFELLNLMHPKGLRKLRRLTFLIIWPIRISGNACKSHFFDTLIKNNSTNLNTPLNMNLYFLFFPPINKNLGYESTEKVNVQERSKKNQIVQVYELFSIRRDKYFQEINFPDSKIDIEYLSQKLVRRSQFNLVEIAAIAQDDINLREEVQFKRDAVSGETYDEFVDGSAVSLYRDLRDMLNFSEKAIAGDSIGFNNNQVYGKSFELIQREQALISISQITILYNRSKFFSYLQPTSYGNGVFLFFVQPPLNSMRNVFFSPFTSDVWIMILCTWLAIIALMMISSGVKYRLVGKSSRIEDVTDATFLNDAYIWAIGALCQKGWPRQPFSGSMRILFICGCLTGLVVYVAYSASIVSVLSIQHVPVKQLTDLISYNFLYYVHEKSSTLQAFLREGIIGKYNLSQDVLRVNTQREVSILLESNNALVTFADVFYSATRTLNYTERFICESISHVPATNYASKSAMFVKKGSQFKETFDYKIMMMKERGFNRRYMNVYISATRMSCQSSTNAKRIKLNYSDLYTAFIIIIVGFSVSLIILFIERLYKRSMSGNGRFNLVVFKYLISSSRTSVLS